MLLKIRLHVQYGINKLFTAYLTCQCLGHEVPFPVPMFQMLTEASLTAVSAACKISLHLWKVLHQICAFNVQNRKNSHCVMS